MWCNQKKKSPQDVVFQLQFGNSKQYHFKLLLMFFLGFLDRVQWQQCSRESEETKWVTIWIIYCFCTNRYYKFLLAQFLHYTFSEVFWHRKYLFLKMCIELSFQNKRKYVFFFFKKTDNLSSYLSLPLDKFVLKALKGQQVMAWNMYIQKSSSSHAQVPGPLCVSFCCQSV